MLNFISAGRIIRKIDKSTYQVEILNYETGEVINDKMRIQKDTDTEWLRGDLDETGRGGSLSSANPELSQAFDAFTSNRKRLTVAELNLSRQKEWDITGYSSAYTKGILEVSELIEVGEKFRKLKVNPLKTHIDYFAVQIEKHIAHIREGILSQTDSNAKEKQNALVKLKELKEKALRAKQEKHVTYKWWVEFNRDLSKVASFPPIKEKNDFPDSHFLEELLIYQFPLSIIFPTITGELGIMALNRAFPEGIYPIGLVNEPKTVDGAAGVSPYGFFTHDLSHTVGGKWRDQGYNSEAHRQFHYRLMKVIENLPPDKRKNIEIAYYTLIHKDDHHEFIESPSERIRELIFNSLQQQEEMSFNFKGLINGWNDRERLLQQFEIIAQDFQRVFSQIKNE